MVIQRGPAATFPSSRLAAASCASTAAVVVERVYEGCLRSLILVPLAATDRGRSTPRASRLSGTRARSPNNCLPTLCRGQDRESGGPNVWRAPMASMGFIESTGRSRSCAGSSPAGFGEAIPRCWGVSGSREVRWARSRRRVVRVGDGANPRHRCRGNAGAEARGTART